ncbi:hypothetical protein [Leeuwenhoekiella sp. NPDC079379]|uniref:hypothetical protein n=1 Tax=Leeuwenhoekiella sp. NPDC079379 TaxID=3364122 RepID=UPI0037C94608
MSQKVYYIYPTYNPDKDTSGNLYIKYFTESFIENEDYVSNCNVKLGIISAFTNLKAEVFIFNWVDLIPYKRYGSIQTILFIFLLPLLWILNKKLVWILHNKQSHYGPNYLVTKVMDLMARFADVVIVHSQEGVEFFNEKYAAKFGFKVRHIPHPVYSQKIHAHIDEKWDYIIWGGIGPHKKILEFLEYVEQSSFFRDKKILICGQGQNENYASKIMSKTNTNIHFINRFITDKELKDLISSSRSTLFTFSPDSVLSSGSLIYSLNFNRRIIGKNVGNFRDLKGIVNCYDTFDEIEKIDISKPQNREAVCSYLEENTWNKFPNKLENFI